MLYSNNSERGLKRILIIAYYFLSKDVVGANRSRSLYKFLKTKGFIVHIIHKNTWKHETGESNIFWGLRCALYIMRHKSSFEKVYISCGPFLPLLPVALAARLTKKPLIIDFRDPWSLNIATNYGAKNISLSLKQRIRLNLSRIIEKFCYKNCEQFIVCTEGMKTDYNELFCDDRKIRLITNGYDFDSKEYDDMPAQCEEIRFVCMGKFAEYSMEKASFILSEIKKYSVATKCPVGLVFIGTNREQNEPIVYESGLSVEWHLRLPYHEALTIAAKADFGLCTVRNETYEYGTKVFDYIGLGLPIFDYFKDDNNFTRYFKEYLSTEAIRIPLEKRLRFSREQVFNCNINMFD